jgi:hypothetical protein
MLLRMAAALAAEVRLADPRPGIYLCLCVCPCFSGCHSAAQRRESAFAFYLSPSTFALAFAVSSRGKAGLEAPRPSQQCASALPKAGAKRLIQLPLHLPLFSFAIFRPEIACQAQELPNSLQSINIRVAF